MSKTALGHNKEHDELSSPLTSMQSFMLHGEGINMYRKPLLYELDDYIDFDKLNIQMYEAIKNHMPFQVKSLKEKKHTSVSQVFVPIPPFSEWHIPLQRISIPPTIHIQKYEKAIALFEGYPWRIKFFEFEYTRYLYIEFHHICLDHYGVKALENSIFDVINHKNRQPQEYVASLQLAVNMESVTEPAANISELLLRYTKRAQKMNFGRKLVVSYELNRMQIACIQQIATQCQVDIEVVYQLIVEHALGKSFEGKAYGLMDNLRHTFGNFEEAGCFNYLIKQHVQGLHAARSRLYALQMERTARKQGNIQILPIHDQVSTVFSFEDVPFRYFNELEIDEYCYYTLSIRIKRCIEATKLILEYRDTEENMQQLIDRFERAIQRLYRQLCYNHAS